MADPYSMVKGGKLKFKKGREKKIKKIKKSSDAPSQEQVESNQSTLKHGGWFECQNFFEISGPVAIEFGDMKYIKSLDNGLLCLGSEHNIGEGPDAEEIVTAMKISDKEIAIKSGYGKYLGVQSDGKVTAKADAVSGREQWEPVFEDGKLALLGHNGRFLTLSDEGIYCSSKTASENEFIQIRSCSKKEAVKTDADNDAGKLKDVELNYVKKYQSFEDRRIRVNTEDRSNIKRARLEGSLHETLLDRREKMKSDKFCK